MSELRQDLISGDWVIVAPGRAKRPDQLIKRREPRKAAPKQGCPFEDLSKSGNTPIFSWPNENNWQIAVIPNKYPALAHDAICSVVVRNGIYLGRTGVGNHELVVTRDHNKNFADLELSAAIKVLEIFQDRFRAMAKDSCYKYVSAFFNWGPAAGASLWHPHYQLLTLPIIPPHIAHSLEDSAKYFKKNKRCVRCDIVRAEIKTKTRIIAENSDAIAIAPYASNRPFEISILPKKHISAFEKTSAKTIRSLAALTQKVLLSIRKNLHDPDLHFFIHSTPTDGKNYSHYHWHAEIVPLNVVSPPGGFEISTVVNINVVDPDEAARILRG